MVWVWRLKKGVGVEPAMRVAVRVLTQRWRWREPRQRRVPMPLLECRQSRRQQSRQRRDATLSPKDAGTMNGEEDHRF
jgi:hypothetical protein